MRKMRTITFGLIIVGIMLLTRFCKDLTLFQARRLKTLIRLRGKSPTPEPTPTMDMDNHGW